MTINIDTEFELPSDTSNYQLIADLDDFSGQITTSLNAIIHEVELRPRNGDNANFNVLTCTSTGSFTDSVSIVPTGAGSPLVISNSSSEFGLSRGTAPNDVTLKYTGGRWQSNSRIQVPNAVEPLDALNLQETQRLIGVETLARNTAITSLTNSKANAWGDLNTVRTAIEASHATRADHASTADVLVGAQYPRIYAALWPPGKDYMEGITVGAKDTKDFTLDLSLYGVPNAYPNFLGLTVVDINGDEVVAMVRAGWSADRRRQPPIRLKNLSGHSENVRVSWMAVYI